MDAHPIKQIYQSVEYPAAYDEVMAVGSVNSQGIVSDDSAQGDQLEIVAPGEQIASTGAFGGVIVTAGTSMAVPHIVGIASILWQKDTSCSSEFIRQLIDYSANLYGDSNAYGNGLAKTTHQTFASEMTGTNLAIIKLGCVYPDNSNTSGTCTYPATLLSGMGENPQWHGHWRNETTYDQCNYLNCYIYFTKEAIAYGGAVSQGTMTDNDFIALDGVITTSGIYGSSTTSIDTWTNLLKAYNTSGTATTTYSNTANNRRMFIWGIALHVATDIYAHNAYDSDGYYISHEDGADKTSVLTKRYDSAAEVASTVMTHCSNKEKGSISDFALSSTYYDGTFYLRYLCSYANEADSDNYATYETTLSAASIKDSSYVAP